ncbi:hypothetical protein ThrDRAFT_00763 [Frankia casuarinae]|jgi:hypothetical protein|uniref:Uncharacterized protein n=1 Tax=Frankia casuarinae (strain DSM 45818 / CECT 9043 / HFP020203 / CcI3) TaxID=106370 RepID=Q2JGD0_FRACC|nr:hypothetical protein [Frankia casuarinae]ABD09662.1 hypothetical protein Francci3_0275 [Frankia casuarinae]EYT93699.1 hypothetical protein ThrDRAFT_00763 [Frankia casuarinae]
MGDESDRRRFLRLAAGASLPPGLFMVRSGRVIPRVIASEDVLNHIDVRIEQITGAYERTPIGATSVYLRRHLPAVRSLLAEGGHPTAVDARLHRAAGRLAALWATTRHDLGDIPGATAAFAEAFGHAEEARDRTLQCWVRLWQSSLARKSGRLTSALALARAATSHVGAGSPAASRAAAIEARTLGALGERAGVHEAINRAWRIQGTLSRAQSGNPGFSIDTLHMLTLAELSAAAYVELGQPDAASVYTDASVHHLDVAGATGLRSMARIAAATAALYRHHVDEAEALVTEALDISEHRPNAVMVTRTHRFLADARRIAGRRQGTNNIAERLDTWTLPSLPSLPSLPR